MQNNIFLQLAIVLSFASLLGYVVTKFKLPLIVAYLLAGVAISLISFLNFKDSMILNFLPNMGIAFVLFLIGMELDLREVKSLGKPILITSLTQIIISSFAGFAIAGMLGFNQQTSVYIGLGLSFSSTVVIIKLLLEKKDLTSLYGKLALGISLVEDLVAIGALVILSNGDILFALNLDKIQLILTLVIKALFLLSLAFIFSRYILRGIFKAVAKSVELLFLTALTWCFIFTSVAVLLGFSIVIGAFLAGIALASSPYHIQIQGKIKPLRDFFLTLFFVYIGAQVRIIDIFSGWSIILILSLYAILIKPLIILLVLGIFGFRKHTLFNTALNLSQISEFSLVLLLMGVKEGIIAPGVLSIMATVAVISIIISSIMITYSKQIYSLSLPILPFFEHQHKIHFLEAKNKEPKESHVVVIGAHHLGGPVVSFLKDKNIPFVVLDFNPRIIEDLREKGIEVIYGDISDPDILEFAGLEKAKLIISTATDIDDNSVLLEECKRKKIKAMTVIRASEKDDVDILKKLGASYVLLPEQVSGEFLVEKLKTKWLKNEI